MRVGVIVAAKGPAPYLAEALRSAQGADAIVVVDHASEPPLAGVDGAQLLRIENGAGGPARARQAGLEALDTELIALLDADDVWEPRKLDAQRSAFASEDAAAVCFGRAEVIDGSGRPTGERLPELPGGPHAAAQLQRSLYERNAIPASSVVVLREALISVGGFEPGADLPAASDWDLWLRLAAAGFDFVYEPGARIKYRRHPGGLTSSVSRLAEAGLAIHERHAGLVDEATVQSAKATDLVALGRGRIRERRYDEARVAFADAGRLSPLTPRDRATAALAAIPGVRGALGRRDPYR